MLILQKPELLCFERNLPDIIIQKTGSETSLMFRLYIGALIIIEEEYVFDSNGFVFIRDLSSLVSLYFDNGKTTGPEVTIYTGLIKVFNFTIDNGADNQFTVLRSSANISDISASAFIISGFLTRIPREKITAANRNEYLSFVQMRYNELFQIKYRLHYYAAGVIAEVSGVLLESAKDETKDRVITFNASLNKILTAAAINPDRVLEYRIWFECTPDDIISSQYSFFPDYTPYRYQRQFIFENSFGVPESFTSTGIATAKKSLETSFAMSGLRMRKLTQDFISTINCNSGFQSKDEMDWLDDFITSFSVSVLRNGKLEEIVVTEVDKSDPQNNQLKSFSFAYRLTGNNHLALITDISGIFDHTFGNTFE